MISVIITIYNLEEYCEKCIESILNQTYTDREIILVNDGSTDGSLKVLEEYQKKYSCIKLIDQPNCGVSSARNAGIEAAEGEYICFVDGDDIASPYMLEKLIRYMDSGTGVVISDQIRIRDQNKRFIKTVGRVNEYTAEQCIELILKVRFPISICAVLFRRNKIGTQRFDCDISLNEDKLFLTEYILANPSLCVKRTDEVIYGYFVREGSASRTDWNGKYDKVTVAERIRERVRVVFPELNRYADDALTASILSTAKNIIRDRKSGHRDHLITLRKKMTDIPFPKNAGAQLKAEYLSLKAGVSVYILVVKIYYLFVPDKIRFRRNEKRIKI